MAENEGARVAGTISVGAAIVAALAYTNSKKAQAAPEGELVIPEEFMQLLVAIAASSEQIVEELSKLAINVQGWPENADSVTSLRVAIAQTGTQLPSIFIPSGMSLVIKAWPLNPGWLQVGASMGECVNVNQSYPLLPTEIVGYQVQNADEIYVAANAAGCFACLTVEQRKRGGG